MDLFSRCIVGWAMAGHMRAELVCDALGMAISARRPGLGLIHHTGKGSRYTGLAFGRRCAEAGIAASTGRSGSCFDNAVTERFFASLETELIDRTVFATRTDAERAVFSYIEGTSAFHFLRQVLTAWSETQSRRAMAAWERSPCSKRAAAVMRRCSSWSGVWGCGVRGHPLFQADIVQSSTIRSKVSSVAR